MEAVLWELVPENRAPSKGGTQSPSLWPCLLEEGGCIRQERRSPRKAGRPDHRDLAPVFL